MDVCIYIYTYVCTSYVYNIISNLDPGTIVCVGIFVWPVAVDITTMTVISDRGGGVPTVGSRHIIKYKYHNSVLPPCEAIPLSTA